MTSAECSFLESQVYRKRIFIIYCNMTWREYVFIIQSVIEFSEDFWEHLIVCVTSTNLKGPLKSHRLKLVEAKWKLRIILENKAARGSSDWLYTMIKVGKTSQWPCNILDSEQINRIQMLTGVWEEKWHGIVSTVKGSVGGILKEYSSVSHPHLSSPHL